MKGDISYESIYKVCKAKGHTNAKADEITKTVLAYLDHSTYDSVDKNFANIWMYEYYNDKQYLEDLLANISDNYYDQNITYLLLTKVGKENIPKEKIEILSNLFLDHKNFIGPEAFALSEMDQEIEKLLFESEKTK